MVGTYQYVLGISSRLVVSWEGGKGKSGFFQNNTKTVREMQANWSQPQGVAQHNRDAVWVGDTAAFSSCRDSDPVSYYVVDAGISLPLFFSNGTTTYLAGFRLQHQADLSENYTQHFQPRSKGTLE